MKKGSSRTRVSHRARPPQLSYVQVPLMVPETWNTVRSIPYRKSVPFLYIYGTVQVQVVSYWQERLAWTTFFLWIIPAYFGWIVDQVQFAKIGIPRESPPNPDFGGHKVWPDRQKVTPLCQMTDTWHFRMPLSMSCVCANCRCILDVHKVQHAGKDRDRDC